MTMRGTIRASAFFLLALAALGLYLLTFLQLKDRPTSARLDGGLFVLPASDACSYYRAGKMLLSGHRMELYDFEVQRQYTARLWLESSAHDLSYMQDLLFYLPPYLLLIFGPLALLTLSHGFLVWYVLNAGFLISIPFLLRKSLGLGNKLTALAVIATPMFFPVELALGQGQLSILLLFLFALAFRELSEGREYRAGCVFAVAFFKPHFVLPLLLIVLVMRKWKIISGFLATSVLLAGISIVLVGWHSTLQYPLAMLRYSRLPVGSGENPEFMFNLRAFAYVLLHARISSSLLHAGTMIASLLLVVLLMVPFWGQRRNLNALDYSFIMVIALVASYHAYLHDMTLLVLPLLLVCSHIASQKLNNRSILLGLMAGALFILPATVPLLFPVVLLAFGVALFLQIWQVRVEPVTYPACPQLVH